jgi:hypothetical protein
LDETGLRGVLLTLDEIDFLALDDLGKVREFDLFG